MPLSIASKAILALSALPFAVAALANSAPAIPAQPEGWTLQSSTNGIVLSSPASATSSDGDTKCNSNDIVLFVIDRASPLPKAPAAKPPASAITDTAHHFVSLTQTHAARFGKLTWRQGVTLEDTLLRDAITIEDPDGNTIHGYAFAYMTAQGLQTLSVYWPNPLTADCPTIAQALDHVALLWRMRYTYDGTPGEVAPLPQSPPMTADNSQP